MREIEPRLVRRILRGYRLPLLGLHGVAHWARVLETGLKLASETGANRAVVALFSVFHDSRRENEAVDPGHGRRGSALALQFWGGHFELSDEGFAQLQYACAHHTDGLTEGDRTVQTCWDADRLDLWRVGIEPSPSLLCTGAARNLALQNWAKRRSTRGHTPRYVTEKWLKGVERAV